jgi:aspartate aminotransferase-like enzyme
MVEQKGRIYEIVQVEKVLVISLYDEGRIMTTTEFMQRYRAHKRIDESRVTTFLRPSASGCRIFIVSRVGRSNPYIAAIFVPEEVDEERARQELAEDSGMSVMRFDAATTAGKKRPCRK